MGFFIRFLLSLVLLVGIVGQVEAQAQSWKGTPRVLDSIEKTTVKPIPSEEDVVRIVFSEIERRIIEHYFGKGESKTKETKDVKSKTSKGKGRRKGLPPGLAKRETLPPGLARNVKLQGTLPPGLQKRELPADLLEQLRKRPSSHKMVIVDNDVLLIEKGTNLILDVIEDVLLNEGKDKGGAQ
jgi:hypothetical protein